MNVWNKVIEDLQKYSEEERSRKSIINRIIAYMTKNSCNGDCNQGRSPCNCEKRYE